MASSSWIPLGVFITSVLSADGVYFQTYPEIGNYRHAIIFCHNLGMRLPVIKSPFDQSLVLAALPQTPKYEYWIGLTFKAVTDRFLWSDNSSLCWRNWIVSASNEPNNIRVQQCVVMRGRSSSPGVWLTKVCTDTYGIICQALPPDRQGNIYTKIGNKVPISLPISKLPVWTKSSCFVLCSLIVDCLMTTYDGASRVCSVYDCTGHLAESPLTNVWVKQSG